MLLANEHHNKVTNKQRKGDIHKRPKTIHRRYCWTRLLLPR